MNKYTLTIFFISILLFFTCTTSQDISQHDFNWNIAVSPFQNFTGNTERDHIGFLLGEYFSSAMASLPGTTVIERIQLQEVFKELNFQLSGMTDTESMVEVGELLNAKQILIGSYSYPDSESVSITARIVNVESGEVEEAAEVIGLKDGDIRQLGEELFYKLIGQEAPKSILEKIADIQKQLLGDDNKDISALEMEIRTLEQALFEAESKINLGVEAQLELLRERSQESDENYAKSLLFRLQGDDEKARAILESELENPVETYLSYNAASEDFLSVSYALEGESIYLQMIENQIKINQLLSEEAQDITLFRNEVKIFIERLSTLLSSQMFSVNVGTSAEISAGTTSVDITIPSDISLSVREDLKLIMERFLSQQSLFQMRRNKLQLTKNPPKIENLLPMDNIDRLFNFDINAGVGVSILFLDREGNTLFRLNREFASVFSLGTDSVAVWDADVEGGFNVSEAKSDWKFDGEKVTVQGRAVKELYSVEVQINPDSFQKSIYSPILDDNIWESIVLHGYRQKYLSINDDSSFPQVKDVIFAQQFFNLPDFISAVPVINESEKFSAFSDITAVIYWGNNSDTSVNVQWLGAREIENIAQFKPYIKDEVRNCGIQFVDSYTGTLTENSVLYFSVPPVDIRAGLGFLRISNEGNSGTYRFSQISGILWENEEWGSLALGGSHLYLSNYESAKAFNTESGKLLWEQTEDFRSGEDILLSEDVLYLTTNSGANGYSSDTSAINRESGQLLWAKDMTISLDFVAADNRLFSLIRERYSSGGYGVVTCLDSQSGNIIWQNESVGGRAIAYAEGKIFVAQGSGVIALNAATGEILWVKELVNGRYYSGSLRPTLGVSNDILYFSNTYEIFAFAVSNGKKIWSLEDFYSSDFIIENSTLFVTGSDRTTAIDAYSGKVLWISNYVAGYSIVADGKFLLVNDRHQRLFVIDKNSGGLVWQSSTEYDSPIISGNKMYAVVNRGLTALDMDFLY